MRQEPKPFPAFFCLVLLLAFSGCKDRGQGSALAENAPNPVFARIASLQSIVATNQDRYSANDVSAILGKLDEVIELAKSPGPVDQDECLERATTLGYDSVAAELCRNSTAYSAKCINKVHYARVRDLQAMVKVCGNRPNRHTEPCLERLSSASLLTKITAVACSSPRADLTDCINKALDRNFSETQLGMVCQFGNEHSKDCIEAARRLEPETITELCARPNPNSADCIRRAIDRRLSPEQIIDFCKQ